MNLTLENIGPIRSADIDFADLTVFVGPQASGKSIALQLLKLVLDRPFIISELQRTGHVWGDSLPDFLDLYLGRGMRSVWNEDSKILYDGQLVLPEKLVSTSRVEGNLPVWANGEYVFPNGPVSINDNFDYETVFYVPAQRVVTFRDGWPRSFLDYQTGDPFVVRGFSENMRQLCSRMQDGSSLAPLWQGLGDVGHVLKNEFFEGYELHLTQKNLKRQFVLRNPQTQDDLTYLAWSTGQRELVPLLLVLQAAPKSPLLSWTILEEIEMGLHPRGVTAALLPVFSLLNEERKICLSTHSSQILDLLWALKLFREKKVNPDRVLDIFQLSKTEETRQWASGVLGKSQKVYYFDRNDGIVKDISDLDPDAEENGQSGWGGLTEFEGRVGNIVAEVMA
jgi:hypothetical protein